MTVSCELPAPAMTGGLKLAVPTPDSSPVSDSATSPAKPLIAKKTVDVDNDMSGG